MSKKLLSPLLRILKNIFKIIMGVSHYNCDNCGEIFADVDGYSKCDGCNERWCNDCYIEKFIFDGKPRCDLCFDATIPEPTPEEMVEFLLKKYNITKEDVIKEMPKDDPGDDIYCTNKISHVCGNRYCENIGEYYHDDDNYPEIGICCISRFGDDQEKWCGQCVKKNKK
jgi:hypothetical protein